MITRNYFNYISNYYYCISINRHELIYQNQTNQYHLNQWITSFYELIIERINQTEIPYPVINLYF